MPINKLLMKAFLKYEDPLEEQEYNEVKYPLIKDFMLVIILK